MRFSKALVLTLLIAFFSIVFSSRNTAATSTVIGQWQNTASLPSELMGFALVRAGNYLFC
ncbi:MAG: hypothetical protein Q7O66_22355 [Dehalococcoidia bacterium]|nr:hypothetical protein [Dehalococcoidia bacterium]